jgi:NAD(P)-dependent dehydrogenase (short-subunit alcohol dehydrogenase family)
MSKTWFITGTSTGIGRALTENLLARGDRVAATLRNPEALAGLQDTHGANLWIAPLDVTDTTAIRTTIDRAFQELGRIDVIVNNAGYGLFGPAEALGDADITRQINTNLLGSIQVIRAAIAHLRAQGGGRILQISSEGGQIAYPNFSIYHATKFGIEGFIESVAQEVGPFNIEFTIFEPGPTATNFRANAVAPPPLEVYADTPSGALTRAIAAGSFALPGDPVKMAQVIIDSTYRSPAPRRLVMGSASYTRIREALGARLAELEAGKPVAMSTDAD